MKRIVFFILLVLPCIVQAQEKKPAFWNDIQQFKKQDSLHAPASNAILFVGSSSFTNWRDVSNYFPTHTIINRGFGGSTLNDVIFYYSDVIYKYHPKQIVIYCGENDLAGDSSLTGKDVYKRFKTLYHKIRKDFSDVPLVYVSMKPSPSRWYMKEKAQEGNKLIRKFLERKNDVYVDVWPGMIGADGMPIPEIFIGDKLHMNAKGYAIWQKLLEPLLLK